MNKEKESVSGVTEEVIEKELQLILLNDDVNTFDYVIDCLIEICGHTPEQAEACAYITHYKGRCAVKSGSFEELKPYHVALLDRHLLATIE